MYVYKYHHLKETDIKDRSILPVIEYIKMLHSLSIWFFANIPICSFKYQIYH